MKDFKLCIECREEMLPKIESMTFASKGKNIQVDGVKVYRCNKCGAEVFDARTIKEIDKQLH